MSREFDFSVVVFAKDTGGLYRTYKNIRKVTREGASQILAVRIEGERDIPDQRDLRELEEAGEKEAQRCADRLQKKYGEFSSADERILEMEKDDGLVLIDGRNCADIVAELRKCAAGRYITFVRAGVSFSGGAADAVQHQFREEKSDIVILKIQGKNNLHVAEHNNYCENFQKDTTLDNNAYLPHQMYSAYTFVTEQLIWPERIQPDTWYLDIMAMVFRNAICCSRLTTASGEDAWVQILTVHNMIEEWKNIMEAPEGPDLFYNRFLKQLMEARKQADIKHEQNADYVLLYYWSRIASGIFEKRESSPEHVDRYKGMIHGFMQQMRFPRLLMTNKHISRANKGYLLEKYFPDIRKTEPERADMVLNPVYDSVRVKIFQQEKDQLHCEFSVVEPVTRTGRICMMTEGRKYEAEQRYTLAELGWCDRKTAEEKLYITDIPLAEIRDFICWGTEQDGHAEKMYNVVYGKYVPFTKRLPLFLHVEDKLLYLDEKILKFKGEDEEDEKFLGHQYEVIAEPYSARRERQLKRKRDRALLAQGKAGLKAVLVRHLYEYKKARMKKQIWLISDRTTRGDDNGEVMFRYLCDHPDPDVEPYFVVEKNTQDYQAMEKLGKVVEPFSWNHKLLFLLQEFSLSSQANKAVINPFGGLEYLYRDIIYDKKLVFLQHGVTKDNQSKWLNKYNRNLFGFIVSTKPEYDSVFSYDYYYPAKNVWLTGMPRYDRLIHDERKYVTVMPTWRKTLSSGTDLNGVWKLGKEFAESEYFHFYNDLLNNRKLLEAADKYGYTICFMPHPNTIDGIHLFHQDPRVKFMDSSYSYKDIFAQTDLMITDYSSVAFDFAYLRKPIVYSQFDRDSFFSGGHSYTEGYFDYERDGFGEVEETLEGTVDRIVEYMADDCRMKEKYRKRMDDTFAFNDRNCSRRVYEMIIQNR